MNGRWTLPDETVLSVAEQSISDGTFKTVFMEGDVRTKEEFLMLMRNPRNFPVFAFIGLDVIGVGWLNNISVNRAFGHFLFLSRAWGQETTAAGRMMLDYWVSFPSDDTGAPLLDVILGSVPETNHRAVNFAKRIGLQYLGRVPRMFVDGHTDERIGADILYYVRS